ncbi:hypothetical protein [Leptospira brenneri]|uniref:hypothetical protein n=1 Tax=Leptospira brenneri TaxID=2023182 RepID=UPI000C2A3667|nr:hypothetical protein [Leptospira brenneri]PJZ43660.1 hypothetical protein CH361_19350 [Leptospira brenneri]
MKENIENRIYNFFINSKDFNGIPLRQISEEFEVDYETFIDMVKELVNERKVSIQSSSNPHIIGIRHYPIDSQIKILDDAKVINIESMEYEGVSFSYENTEYPICLYPSQEKLESNRDCIEYGYACYSKALALGDPQLKPIFFDIDVLDRYFNDPRFDFNFEDYSGNISCIHDDLYNPLVRNEDNVLIQSFGIGFDNQKNRVAVVYLRYLHNLTAEHQIYWKNKEKKQKCTILTEYFHNTIEGNWTFSQSIFSAFLLELKCLNELSYLIYNTHLFHETFEGEKRPKEFTFFFIPTIKNYNDFILLLDKLISENLNKTFFEGKLDLFILREENGIHIKEKKGTLALLEEWLTSIFKIKGEGSISDIIKPFKNIRKERQKPAHKVTKNAYDLNLIEKQKEIIGEAYESMRQLRHIFHLHPKGKKYKLPDYIDNIKIISL